MPRKKASRSVPRKRTPGRPAIVVRLGPNKYAVAVWREDEDGEPVYEIAQQDIRDVTVAATVARTEEAKRRSGPGGDGD